jgi:hypothetical protein
MYQVQFTTFLPATDTMVNVVAYCKSIIGTTVLDLSFKFLDKDDELMDIEYNKEFFSDIEDEAVDALLDEFYNHSRIEVN